MNSTAIKIDPNNNANSIILKFSEKNERKILKAFLLERLHRLFIELFDSKIQYNQKNFSMECYAMDNKIIQLLIQGIIETGEYTLEGVAHSTHIPFDVIYDAACGINNHISITAWTKIIDLYIQLKPDTVQALTNKLLEITNQNRSAFSSLLNET